MKRKKHNSSSTTVSITASKTTTTTAGTNANNTKRKKNTDITEEELHIYNEQIRYREAVDFLLQQAQIYGTSTSSCTDRSDDIATSTVTKLQLQQPKLTKGMLVSLQEFQITSCTCSLCSSTYIQPVSLASCAHTFCKRCIMTYTEHSWYCPIPSCKLPVSMKQQDRKFYNVNAVTQTVVTAWANICHTLMNDDTVHPYWWKPPPQQSEVVPATTTTLMKSNSTTSSSSITNKENVDINKSDNNNMMMISSNSSMANVKISSKLQKKQRRSGISSHNVSLLRQTKDSTASKTDTTTGEIDNEFHSTTIPPPILEGDHYLSNHHHHTSSSKSSESNNKNEDDSLSVLCKPERDTKFNINDHDDDDSVSLF